MVLISVEQHNLFHFRRGLEWPRWVDFFSGGEMMKDIKFTLRGCSLSIQSSKINVGVICETIQITSPRDHQRTGRKESERFWLGLLGLALGQTVFFPLCEN